MYVLLKDTDDLEDKGFYIKTEKFNRDIEKNLIELYYRGVVEGLVEYSEDTRTEKDLEVLDIQGWLSSKKEKNFGIKVTQLIETIEDMLEKE